MSQPVVATRQMIEEIFDGAAPTYDRVGPALFAGWGARLIERMELAPGTRILDVATGRGAALLPAAHRIGPSGRAIGIDLSAAMLREAQGEARGQGLSQVALQRADAERLPFPSDSFDAAACAFSLFFMPDMAAALREMHRVCRPGGRIGVTVFGRTPPPFDPGWALFAQQARAYGVATRTPQRVAYTPEELTLLLTDTGFRDVRILAEACEAVYASEADWWAFQLTLGSRATILGMDGATRERFREEYLGKLRPLFREDGLHLGVSVLYAIAHK